MLATDFRPFRWAAAGIFGIVFVLIATTFRHYGITWDEELQNRYGEAVADFYLSGFKNGGYDKIFNLYLYGGMFDGLAALIDRNIPMFTYDVRHFLNALFGLLGLWGTWKVAHLLGDDVVALIAVIICATVPSYYGHMFNNPKDIPFAAGIIWTIYFMSRSYVKPDKTTLIKLATVLGLTLGVRVGGAMIFAFWLVPIGFVALLPVFKNPGSKEAYRSAALDIWAKFWRMALPVGMLAYAIMLLCWPWAQEHPIANPWRAFTEFGNFPQDVEVLLDGTTYRSTELPWYYVPLYFGIQLPEYLLALLVGAVLFFPRIWRELSVTQRQSLSLALLMAFVPVLYAVLQHPALYDTVRHFMFGIPVASILAALGARAIYGYVVEHIDATRRRFAMGVLIAAFSVPIIIQIGIMVHLHPYEYIYANQLAGGVSGAFGRYETDYWGSSFKEAAERIQTYVANEGGVPPGKIYRIAICGPWSSAMIYMPPNFQPVIANEPAEFFLSTTRWMCQDMRPGKEFIRVERMGVPLSIVKDLRGGYEWYEGNEYLRKN